jgi:hypothetical protein
LGMLDTQIRPGPRDTTLLAGAATGSGRPALGAFTSYSAAFSLS